MKSQNSIIRVAALSLGSYVLLVVCVTVLTGCGGRSATRSSSKSPTSTWPPQVTSISPTSVGTVVNAAALIDVAHAGVLPTGSLKDARSGHTATLLNAGSGLIVGGVNETGQALASAEVFH